MNKPIERAADSAHLDRIEGVGPHQPRWEPCGNHPSVLGCPECLFDWPCPPILDVIAELEAQADGLCCGGVLQRWIAQLRGEVSEAQTCDAWDGCPQPAGHNRGRADIPANHGRVPQAIAAVGQEPLEPLVSTATVARRRPLPEDELRAELKEARTRLGRIRAVLSDPMLNEAMMLDQVNAILDEMDAARSGKPRDEC
jgi:hypothetical protein